MKISVVIVQASCTFLPVSTRSVAIAIPSAAFGVLPRLPL